MSASSSSCDAILKSPCAGVVVGAHSRRKRYGTTLIELLVVLFIIAVMLGLLLPALQSARRRVNVNVCQNNTRQLSMALGSFINAKKRFSEPNHWTIDVLKWSEEWELADLLNGGINEKNKNSRRPHLFRCPAQDDPLTSVPGVDASHYVLTVQRPKRDAAPSDVSWMIHDRELLTEQVNCKPWYVGPELTPLEQQQLFSRKIGPHQDGQFYSNDRSFPD